MKDYVIFFAKGMSGQWFAWFVNEHDGFRKNELVLEPLYKKEYNNVDATIYPDDRHVVRTHYDLPFSKQCLLIFGYHFYSTVVNYSGVGPILSKLNNMEILFLVARKNTEVVNVMNERLEFLSRIAGANYLRVDNNKDDIEKASAIIKEVSGKDIFEFDITRLLSLEDAAYYELCEFLDVVPLSNWKDLVADMMLQIYNLDVRK